MDVNGIPLHTRWLVERLLGSYCSRICPPHARHAVLLGYTLEADNLWQLMVADDAARWRRYAPLPSSRNFLDLLREVDADPSGAFWGRIDGKSLRWCSARGRCDDCEEKYCRVLGVGRGDSRLG